MRVKKYVSKTHGNYYGSIELIKIDDKFYILLGHEGIGMCESEISENLFKEMLKELEWEEAYACKECKCYYGYCEHTEEEYYRTIR